jgi:hypothetical protein
MKLSKARLVLDALTLGRCLTVTTPSLDWALAVRAAWHEEERKNGPLVDVWYRMQTGDKVGFFFESSAGEGRYSRYLPEGVDPRTVRTVNVDPDARSASVLVSQLLSLIAGLAKGSTISIEGTNESIEPIDFDAKDSALESLYIQLAAAQKAASPGYNEDIVRRMSSEIREGALNASDRPYAIRQKLMETTNKVGDLRTMLAADGVLASWFLIYRDVCRAVEQRYSSEGDERASGMQLLRYVGFGAAGTVEKPLDLTAMIVDKLVRENLQALASDIGHEYLDKCEGYIDRALDGRSLEAFGGSLYAAGLYGFAARQIFFSLKSASESYQKPFDVADERSVRVNTSFNRAVENRNGQTFLKHRAKVERARQQGGEKAAEQSAFELIEMHYFYPRFYKAALLGREEPTLSG